MDGQFQDATEPIRYNCFKLDVLELLGICSLVTEENFTKTKSLNHFDKWEKRTDGKYLRRITKFKELFDVSPVYRPAYDSTSVKIDTRRFEEVKKQEKEDYKELREGLN